MKIIQVKIKNFRSYGDEISVDFNNLTAFVGKNDIGKSTILEALDIFFGGEVIKLDLSDINKACQKNNDQEIQIAVVFDDFPSELVLDTSNFTDLKSEYLLNKEGKLEIVKKYLNAGKPKIFIRAYHPSHEKCFNLHSLKNADLKKIIKDEEIECEDQTRNAVIRKAIWNHYSKDLQLQEQDIETNKEDAKNIWGQLEKELPHYALFQSDRSNSDGDSEVQNPLQSAVDQIFKEDSISEALEKIANEVRKRLEGITNLTLEKVGEMNPEIAKSLKPHIPETKDLKWKDVFKKVSIMGDEDIPINKRGSGVKRLILLNFFRAEAETKSKGEKRNVIYAIEEPETSQHQEHQRMLIDALIELSEQKGIQVILTTHSPTIVKELKFENLRVVRNGENGKEIIPIKEARLPISSLNEANFLAFGEAGEEYHDELYGYLEEKDYLEEYLQEYKKVSAKKYKFQDKTTKEKEKEIALSEYIRHQIHHPENKRNERYTFEELQESIKMMRDFIKQKGK